MRDDWGWGEREKGRGGGGGGGEGGEKGRVGFRGGNYVYIHFYTNP